jgi:hypothetical protein
MPSDGVPLLQQYMYVQRYTSGRAASDIYLRSAEVMDGVQEYVIRASDRTARLQQHYQRCLLLLAALEVPLKRSGTD